MITVSICHLLADLNEMNATLACGVSGTGVSGSSSRACTVVNKPLGTATWRDQETIHVLCTISFSYIKTEFKQFCF